MTSTEIPVITTNQPLPPIPTPAACGPFLKYCKVDYATSEWFGSILYVTSSSSATNNDNSSQLKDPPTILAGAINSPEADKQLLTPIKLSSCDSHTFWRFSLKVKLGEGDCPVKYQYLLSCDTEQKYHFWVGGREQKQWRWAFTSCNGFSMCVDQVTRDKMGGVPAMWHDLLRRHDDKPFLALIGGGDQIYCDPVWDEPLLQEWLHIKGRDGRQNAPWTEEFEKQIQTFYLNIYLRHFSIDGFKDAFAQIPTVNMLDDHDMWDGMGSYPEYLEKSNIFVNLKRIAYKYYLLFQQHTTPTLAKEEGYIGCDNGSYSIITSLGPEVGLAMIDARGERSVNQILSTKSWDAIFAELKKLPSSIRHLAFVTGVPIVYPRMEVADTVLERLRIVKRGINKGFNKVAGALGIGIGTVFGKKAKAGFDDSVVNMKLGLGKSGMMGSLLNKFGEPELLDDLIDHWTHENHSQERYEVVDRLQRYAFDNNVRVTLLAGDVHCAAVGKFYAKFHVNDYRLMYQIISSAVANVPPPDSVLSALHRNATRHYFGAETREEMVDLFIADVDGTPMSKKKLMGRRNWLLVDGMAASALVFSIQVENKDWKLPSCAYTVEVPVIPT